MSNKEWRKQFLEQKSSKALKDELKEYYFRKKNRMPNRHLYFGLVFRDKSDVEFAKSILKSRGDWDYDLRITEEDSKKWRYPDGVAYV